MSNEMLLNGLWDFTFDGGTPTKMSVPGCFDAAGPFRGQRGRGVYSRLVNGSGPMELNCGGLGLRASFYWDGKEIGREVTAYAPVRIRFDAGQPGDHELKIVCDNTIEETPESEFRRFYDFYGYGGIYRDVTLRPLPSTFFDSVRPYPDPENGTLRIRMKLSGPERETEVRIDGTLCGTFSGSGEASFRIPSPDLWSPDSPRLHLLELDCGTDRFSCRFGLRKIEVKDRKIFLNGKPLRIAGVNRHDVFPDTGAAVSPDRLRRDLIMIKEAGFNMIRGSHYPQSQAMLDLADELGLLVWDEILGWENPLESLTDKEFQRRQVSSLTRMIESSLHHPCILAWGFLNEAATNDPAARDCVKLLYQTAKELDPDRLVTYATMHGEKDVCLDLVDAVCFNTYPGWYSGTHLFFENRIVTEPLKKLISFVRSTPAIADKPVLISEIGAGALVGDHSGRRWSEEYQAQLIECAVSCALEDPECSGILLWQFCNTPVDDNGRIMMRPRGFNNKGLVDEFRNPKLAWNLFPCLLKRLGIR